MPEVNELRRWLRKHPHPVKVRAYTDDDDEKVINVGVARSKWRDLEEACSAYAVLEALNGEGEILRTFNQETEESEERPGKLPKDQNLAMVTQIAKLLAEAGDLGAVRYREIVELAFNQNAVLIGVLSGRLQALEKAWHHLLMSQPEKLSDSDPNVAMISTLLGGLAPALPAILEKLSDSKGEKSNGKAKS